ncbi:hypothetical protein CLOP_g5171 [Closterium sp. NIES-67]|nr:hypothetical protein CLOP_g5171 [Closterium sp. NIES-67]
MEHEIARSTTKVVAWFRRSECDGADVYFIPPPGAIPFDNVGGLDPSLVKPATSAFPGSWGTGSGASAKGLPPRWTEHAAEKSSGYGRNPNSHSQDWGGGKPPPPVDSKKGTPCKKAKEKGRGEGGPSGKGGKAGGGGRGGEEATRKAKALLETSVERKLVRSKSAVGKPQQAGRGGAGGGGVGGQSPRGGAAGGAMGEGGGTGGGGGGGGGGGKGKRRGEEGDGLGLRRSHSEDQKGLHVAEGVYAKAMKLLPKGFKFGRDSSVTTASSGDGARGGQVTPRKKKQQQPQQQAPLSPRQQAPFSPQQQQRNEGWRRGSRDEEEGGGRGGGREEEERGRGRDEEESEDGGWRNEEREREQEEGRVQEEEEEEGGGKENREVYGEEGEEGAEEEGVEEGEEEVGYRRKNQGKERREEYGEEEEEEGGEEEKEEEEEESDGERDNRGEGASAFGKGSRGLGRASHAATAGNDDLYGEFDDDDDDDEGETSPFKSRYNEDFLSRMAGRDGESAERDSRSDGGWEEYGEEEAREGREGGEGERGKDEREEEEQGGEEQVEEEGDVFPVATPPAINLSHGKQRPDQRLQQQQQVGEEEVRERERDLWEEEEDKKDEERDAWREAAFEAPQIERDVWGEDAPQAPLKERDVWEEQQEKDEWERQQEQEQQQQQRQQQHEQQWQRKQQQQAQAERDGFSRRNGFRERGSGAYNEDDCYAAANDEGYNEDDVYNDNETFGRNRDYTVTKGYNEDEMYSNEDVGRVRRGEERRGEGEGEEEEEEEEDDDDDDDDDDDVAIAVATDAIAVDDNGHVQGGGRRDPYSHARGLEEQGGEEEGERGWEEEEAEEKRHSWRQQAGGPSGVCGDHGAELSPEGIGDGAKGKVKKGRAKAEKPKKPKKQSKEEKEKNVKKGLKGGKGEKGGEKVTKTKKKQQGQQPLQQERGEGEVFDRQMEQYKRSQSLDHGTHAAQLASAGDHPLPHNLSFVSPPHHHPNHVSPSNHPYPPPNHVSPPHLAPVQHHASLPNRISPPQYMSSANHTSPPHHGMDHGLGRGMMGTDVSHGLGQTHRPTHGPMHGQTHGPRHGQHQGHHMRQSVGEEEEEEEHGGGDRREKDRWRNVIGRPLERVEERYEMVGEVVGRGYFGDVVACRERRTGEYMACKVIKKDNIMSEDDAEDITNEVAALETVRGHPHIVQLMETIEDEEAIHLILDLCEGGTLQQIVRKEGPLSERRAAAVCRGVAQALEWCHGCGVMHRDVKPDNILLVRREDDTYVKLTDFGIALFFEPGVSCTETVGSAAFIAPEMLQQAYDQAVDAWSLGCVLFFLLAGVVPFRGATKEETFERIMECHVDRALRLPPWPRISPGAKDLVRRLLTKDPRERITLQEVLRHPWITGN